MFDYGTVTTANGRFAYIRCRSFEANDADDLVNALAPVLPQLTQNGLIFDIRGNHGEYISAGERILQLFSEAPIRAARFQFRVTPATRAMVNASDEFKLWRAAFEESFDTGELYTQGFPIEGTDADVNKVGRRYSGPVVLVSDALAFSTADIVAAGFLDNKIGRVICTDANMAAAGGNNWRWDVVRFFSPDIRLDTALKGDLDAQRISPAIRSAFDDAGAPLSPNASVSVGQQDGGDIVWTVRDGAIEHTIRLSTDISPPLNVYLYHSRFGLAGLPAGVTLGLTMRRSVRLNDNEGRILEDIGIEATVLYRMTVRDVMEQNQDLMERAGRELLSMKGTG